MLSNQLGAVHKRGPQLRWKGVVQSGQEGRGFFRCRVRTFWRKKLWIFRNLWCVRTDKGVWASANMRSQFFA